MEKRIYKYNQQIGLFFLGNMQSIIEYCNYYIQLLYCFKTIYFIKNVIKYE